MVATFSEASAVICKKDLQARTKYLRKTLVSIWNSALQEKFNFYFQWVFSKTKVDKLDIDKLTPVPVDLSKLSNVVKNEVVKNTEYNAKMKNIEDKIPDITNLTTKTTLNTKINEVKTEISSISDLAITLALTFSNLNFSSLVKKIDYDTKVNKIENKITDHKHDKYITTLELNKLTAKNFAARLSEANLVTNADFDNKLSNLNRKINSNKAMHLLVEKNVKKLKTFD